jgi:hypothetical protein
MGKSVPLGTFPLALIFLLAAYLVLQVSINPEIGLLPPSTSSGYWILAPFNICRSDSVEGNGAIFTKEIIVPEMAPVIESAIIKVIAAGSYELRLNGQLISGARQEDPKRNWRISQEFNLADQVHTGSNTLEILVRNTARQPALLVSGALNIKPHLQINIDSDVTWRVLSLSRDKNGTPETMPPPRDFYSGHISEWNRNAVIIRVLRPLATIMAYLVLALASLLYLRRAQRPRPMDIVLAHFREVHSVTMLTGHVRVRKWMFIILLIALYFPMAVIRDPNQGWDADGHIEHLRYVATGRGVPMADQGWQMYQPPAYYLFAAAVYRVVLPITAGAAHKWQWPCSDFLALKAVQLLTPIFALMQVLVVLKLIRYIFSTFKESFSFTVVAFVTLMPMQIYSSSFISNEMFSALMISIAFFLLIVMVTQLRFGIGYSAALGSLIALACLSKYTGFLVAMTAFFIYVVFFVTNLVRCRQLVISFLTVSLLFVALAGPYYFRNFKKYGKLLPYNTEFVKDFQFEYFDVAFMMDPLRIGLGVVDKFRSRSNSFVDGNYSSMWLDNSHKSHPWTRGFDASIYYLAIFPTLLIVFGFLRALAACRADSAIGRAYLPVLTIFILALFSYLYFVLRFGSYEAVKAFYLLSQLAPLAVFFEVGCRNGVDTEHKKVLFAIPMALLYSVIVIYYLLVPLLIGKGL